jgi:hypothetical protein
MRLRWMTRLLVAIAAGSLATPAAAAAAELTATPSTLRDVFSGAAGGDTIHLAAGDYGRFGGGSKSAMVTIVADPGVAATIDAALDGAAFIRFQGLTVTSADLVRSHDIQFVRSTFTGSVEIATTGTDQRILFDRNTHDGIMVCPTCHEGRITVKGAGESVPNGVAITNSRFSGGNSDGVQIVGHAYGTRIGPGNEFTDLLQGDPDLAHTDPIQLYGSSHTLITGNWMHGNETGIMAPDGADHEVIEHNVIVSERYPWGIVLGSDDGSVVRHNTLPTGRCSWNLRCGILRIDGGNAQTASRGTAVQDHILGELAVSEGSVTSVESHNLIAAGEAAGPEDLRGVPTFSGGAAPAAWDGFRLTGDSLGAGSASDGADRGAEIARAPDAAEPRGAAPPTAPRRAEPPGLVAAYGFDERHGRRVRDESGRGNGGRVRGARRTKVARSGRALAFDGHGDVVTVPDASSLDLGTGMTLEAWVRPTGRRPAWAAAVVKRRGRGQSYALYARSPSGRPVGVGGARRLRAGPRGAVRGGAWRHVALTYDGARLRLYVDGVKAGERVRTGRLPAGGGPLLIGGSPLAGRGFRGQIDDVRIYDRGLGRRAIRRDMRTPV